MLPIAKARPFPPAPRSAAALIFIVAALLQGCLSQQFFQNAAHRAAAHSKRNPAPSEKAAFANLRSVTLLAATNAKPAPKQKSILLRDLSEGQAACVSADGYLLTAAHVFAGRSIVFAVTAKPQRGRSWWKADPRPGENFSLTSRDGSTRIASRNRINLLPLRPVFRFAGTDIALLHAPNFHPPAYFKMADAEPREGAALWAHCAPFNGPPNCVAGKVFSPLKAKLITFFSIAGPGNGGFPGRRSPAAWRTVTDAVLQCGDSGGAAFDDDGRLTGIFSTGATTPGIFGPPISLWGAFEGVPAQKIQAAITADRAAQNH